MPAPNEQPTPSGDGASGASASGGERAPFAALAGVAGVAALIRALHLREVAANDPFWTIASVDGAVYAAQANALLAGDGFGEGVLFLGPLYPLFMAAVFGVVGPSLPALKLVHLALGALAAGLVHELARALFDRRVALVAGLGAALYGQHVFYAGTVMIVNLQVPLVLGLVLAAVHGLRRPGFAIWAACGVLLGLAALARQTVLLVAPVLALWILFGMAGTHAFKQRLAWGVTFGVAVCALVLPFTARNWVVGDDLVLLNSTGGYNFYMGNRAGTDGTWKLPPLRVPYRVDNPRAMRDAFTTLAERDTGRDLRPSEVSAYWRAKGMDEIAAAPGAWIALEARKAALFVNADEIWNNRSRAVSERFSRVLRLPLVELGLIAPLGLIGLWMSRARWRELLPVHATLAAYLVASLLFFVLSRYRMPATLLLLPFAGAAASAVFDGVRERAWRALAPPVLVGVLATTLVHLPLVTGDRLHMAWYNLGNKYRELERFDEAIDAYHASLAEQPGAISTHNNLAIALERGGRRTEAIDAWRRVGEMGRRIGSARHVERAERHLQELVRELDGAAGASDGARVAP